MKRSLSIFTLLITMMMSVFTQTAFAGGWELLGEKKVSRRAEADTIRVGLRDGAFKRLQFKVKGADVDFDKVIVHYENGQNREVAIRSKVKKGGSSRVIDLPGKARAIEKVKFYYDTEGTGRAQASVLLLGKSA
ncbi:hypothetical protein [Endozoicomonas sp. 4G]|uniref:DUF2541 family protein n=1 Tax=Endozoicomonas sp. 4G TaxID=2872754 RepID=UPI002078A823|nr:hypothetical protein [Endozoicomonas sp. 4G]